MVSSRAWAVQGFVVFSLCYAFQGFRVEGFRLGWLAGHVRPTVQLQPYRAPVLQLPALGSLSADLPRGWDSGLHRGLGFRIRLRKAAGSDGFYGASNVYPERLRIAPARQGALP